MSGIKRFAVDFQKAKSLEDLIEILEAINFVLTFDPEDMSNCPQEFRNLYEKGFLKEIE